MLSVAGWGWQTRQLMLSCGLRQRGGSDWRVFGVVCSRAPMRGSGRRGWRQCLVWSRRKHMCTHQGDRSWAGGVVGERGQSGLACAVQDKHGTPISGWKHQLVFRIGVSDRTEVQRLDYVRSAQVVPCALWVATCEPMDKC